MSAAVKVTLKKANKLKTILRSICLNNKVGTLEAFVKVEYSQNNPVKLETFKGQIEKSISDARSSVDTYVRQNSDHRKLKDLIFKTNIENGISDILSQIELLELKKKMYFMLKNNLENASSGYGSNGGITIDIDASYAALIREKEKNYYHNNHVTSAVYDLDTLHEKVKEIIKEISSLEDQRDLLNATTSIDINVLSPETLEELGI
jgi:hypothetical protein